jgi:hypothetical protein
MKFQRQFPQRFARLFPTRFPQATPVVAAAVVAMFATIFLGSFQPAAAGPASSQGRYQALAPISQGNLTIFPVVSTETFDTHEFLTLDEGLHSGAVIVTEAGSVPAMIRRHGSRPSIQSGAEVNRLLLVNNSARPLLLLAGEIVTGGKQDRIVGKDRIIPADSDADLGVFCVEPGRWVQSSAEFKGAGMQMAQPSIRNQAIAAKDQSGVWAAVRSSENVMVEGIAPASPTAAAGLAGTTSYARVMQNKDVEKRVDSVAAPLLHSYQSLMRNLRARKAVGVVVAVNGKIIWADIFASTELLEKYWPKLARSYAAEALTAQPADEAASQKSAQQFLERTQGAHEVVESEPGVYRHSEITGDDFKLFDLTSLLPGTGFELHLSKMAE